MYVETEKCLVIPDVHGASDKLHAVLDHYENENPQFVSLGDVLDGGQSPRDCVQMLMDIGAIVLLGNHEWTALAAMQENNSSSDWQDLWLKSKRYDQGTSTSYGITTRLDRTASLREKMHSLGHLAFLTASVPYLETPDFIAIHAGLDDSPWSEQKLALEAANQRRLNGNYDDEPVQIFDLKFLLATQLKTDATDKLVVSGHAHNRTSSMDDYSFGNRLRLASQIHRGQPLFVWESWTGAIVSF